MLKKTTLIRALLQTTEGIDTLDILFMRTSQHGNKNTKNTIRHEPFYKQLGVKMN